MATQVFLLNTAATTHRGTNTAKLNTVASGWVPLATSTSRGPGVTARTTNTVAGTTNGVEVTVSGINNDPLEWITPPVDADVTISGTVTGNIWASESNMSANVAINFQVLKMAATDGTLTEIVKSARVTEVAVTTRAVNNFTATPTSTALNKGDRLVLRIFGDDAGTMASGFTFDMGYGGTTAAADGDTYITFNETFGFQTTDPTGTTIYPTSTNSTVSTASDDKEAWTSRGGSVTAAATNSTAGWTAPLQVTNGGGLNVMDWFTRPLTALTLSGLVKGNVRFGESNSLANMSVGVEIARVDGDGTNPVVWGYANRDASTTSGNAGEIATTETAYTVYVAGDDLSITDGQRIRIRFYVDDCADVAMATGRSASLFYAGTSGGASGDTFLIFEQTLTEFSSAPAARVVPERTLTKLVAVQRGATF